MCHGALDTRKTVRDTMSTDFPSSFTDMKGLFASLINSEKNCSTVYYLTGWYADACKGVTHKRKNGFLVFLGTSI